MAGIVCAVLFRFFLPLIILVCVLFRPCLISGIYLLLMLITAMVPVPTSVSMKGSTGLLLKLMITISTITSLCQITFQVLMLLLFKPYGNILKNCQFLEKVLRHSGFVKLNRLDVSSVFLWVTPEAIMFVSSITFYIVFSKLTKMIPIEEEEENIGLRSSTEGIVAKKKDNKKFFVALGKYLVISALCISGILKPSVLGGFYFLIFLSSATWWGCYKTLEKGFGVVLKFCMLFVCLHIFTLYTYQTDWPKEYVAINSTYARYFGLSSFMHIDCEEPRRFLYDTLPWYDYVNFLYLFILFFLLAVESKYLLQPKPPKKQGTFSRLEGSFKGPLSRQLSQRLSDKRLRRSGTTRNRWQSATRKVRDNIGTSFYPASETSPLLHSVTSSNQRYGINVKGPAILQDSTGSMIVTNENPDEMQLKDVNEDILEPEDDQATCFEKTLYVFESILLFVIKTSYIGTNIIMMTWSITYHSWLTFILLLWASGLWMLPNQRKFMLRFSPFLVLYALFLLISAYIYSMDLTEAELPTKIDNIDLVQIGFVRNTVDPCKQLIVKCLFTAMFWITLRQYTKERKEARQNSALADMVAPLQLSVGTATGIDHVAHIIAEGQKCNKKKVYPEKLGEQAYLAVSLEQTDNLDDSKHSSGLSKDQEKGNQVLTKVGNLVRKLLTQFWIWIVAITLFGVAITGERMTSFRILYMALFLVFILTFQFSFNAWRRMMFGFWLTVIIYSMLILVLVYTYQFDNFDKYWEKYLHVSLEQQLDIGLEKYETKQLFVRLVTPTFFVIITVIQLHYFHKDFMELSKPTQIVIADNAKSEANSSAQGGGNIENENDEDEEEVESKHSQHSDTSDSDSAVISSRILKKKFARFLVLLEEGFNIFLLFLEIHMPKFVLLMTMLLCVMDVAAINIILVVLLVLGATIGKSMLRITIYMSSLIVCVMLLAKMVYQIQYMQHDMWNVTCSIDDKNETTVNITGNNAEWLGFNKTSEQRKLPELVKWNIGHILVVTLWCIINVRQKNYRAKHGDNVERAFFMFPSINISNANKNLCYFFKYLSNYFFYRLGVEICLIATVVTITLRMDMYALLYAIWLVILVLVERKKLAKIWNFYLIFIAVFIPIQYLMVIGLPPGCCIIYPWDSNDMLRSVQEWAFLMDPISPPPSKKLLCDFCLLLLVARQSLVFRIENRYLTSHYSGGSNESIIHNAENNDFIIPVPDFITYNRTYLDVFKKTIFLPFMWVTLAIVFLAGANRVNLFSLGYLLGSFYFLWQGSDIYLKPIHKILKGWNALITYNVIVIIIKVILQLIGCVFFDYMEANACWFIQLLGISCLRKFKVAAFIVPGDEAECTVPKEYIGLAWDGACFSFLYLQRRIFQSYNFFHIINEGKASAILASRGAELIEELRYKRMSEQDEAERKIIEKIKMKMDKIKENQKKILGPNYNAPTNHYVDEPPLARSSSMASCTSGTSQQTTTPGGYHTPIDEDEEADPAPLTPVTESSIQPNAPSPYSAIMTGCLEGYLEPQRMSFSSPPNSELNPRPPSPDDSFPVFSPPPYDDAPPYAEAVSEPTTVVQRNHAIGPPWMAGSLITPRQSVMSFSSRSPMSHHTYTIFPNSNRPLYRRDEPESYKRAVRSGDYYMFDDLDNEEFEVFEEEEEVSERDSFQDTKKSKPTLSELLDKTMKTSVSTALKKSHQKRRLSLQYKPTATLERRTSVPFSAPPTVEIYEPEEPTPGPSQSKEEEDEIYVATEEKVHKKKCCQRFLVYVVFLWVLIESVMITAINHLNKRSRDYRYVMRVLTKEKKILKEKTKYNVGTRTGLNDLWIPSYSYRELLLQQRIMDKHSNEKLVNGDESVISASALPQSDEKESYNQKEVNIPEIRILAPSLERGLDSSSSVQQVNFLEEMEGAELSSYDQPTIIRLLLAVWYIILSHSDMLCYFIIFLNQIKNATSISLPLPLMVFFWGTLTIPRPSKIFWITIIAYTQVIVLLKCVLQFPLLPWNDENLPKQQRIASIIGIERRKDFAFWDLLLLLVVFFHRFMLKCLGLWKTTTPVPIALLSDGEYTIINGELVPKVEVKRPKLKHKDQKRGTDLEQLVDEFEADQDVTLIVNEVEPGGMLPSSLRLVVPKYHEAFRLFFQQLFDPTSRVAADVYSFMFLCDFFNFFVLLFGYSSFGSQQSDGDGGVASYLKNNRVPVLFLILLIIQFLIIITDRAIFLRKNITAKIVFQFLQIFMLHLWLFVIYPIMTDRSVNSVVAPQMYYMVKCFYLLLSAYQIRCGYPTRILGNFLCKGFGYLNLFLFRGFMIIPFLFELRTIMDWMWTDTSMTVFDWIKMEDIFAHIYQLKCTRHIENEYPQPRGERKKPLIKYAMGGGLLAIIIAVVWFPLVFFSLGNTVGKPNPPYDVTIDLRLGPYEPLYRMSAQSNSIFQFTSTNYDMLTERYVTKPRALNFMSDYEYGDVAAIKLSSDSATVWSISPPDLQRMIEEVASENTLELQLQYQVSHKSNSKEDPGVMRDKVVLQIEPNGVNKVNPIRQQLLEMLQNHTSSSKPILLTYLMPKFIKVTNRGTAEIIDQLMDTTVLDKRSSSLRNMTLLLARENENLWWEIKEECDDYNYLKYLQSIPYADCNSFMMYTFSDKIFPATLNIITGGGIIGLYTTLVFVASRVLRGFFSEICFKIMFDDMPCVDRVLQLTLDIYLVREAGEFALEEDLFAKLVFLYRSPETLIKWTRPIEEAEDEDDPEGDGQNN